MMRDVSAAYNSDPSGEWERLERDPYHEIEFHVTMDHLRANLKSGCVVLDAGGGPGRVENGGRHRAACALGRD